MLERIGVDPLRAPLPIPAALLLALCLASPAVAAPPATPPVDDSFGESVDVNVVNVEVYVTDKQGRPVTGLTRADFELLEDGKKVEITNFEALTTASRRAPAEPSSPTITGSVTSTAPAAAAAPTGDPLYVAIYVDNFNIRPSHRARALQQIRDYLDKELVPGDRVMVVTSDLGLQVRQPFTDDRAALARALDEVAKSATRGDEDARAKKAAMDSMFAIKEEDLLGPRGGANAGSRAGGEEGGGDEGGGAPACSLRIAEPIKGYAESARQEVLRTVSSLKLFVNSLSGLPGRKILLHVSDGISVTPGEELFQALQELCGGGGTTSGYTGSSSDPASIPAASSQSPLAYQASQAMLDAQRYSTAKEWTELAAHANANRVTLYTLQASGLEAAGPGADTQGGGRDQLMRLGTVTHIETNNRRDSLNVLASDTGGRAIFNANDLRPELARIQEDMETYYSLGFAPRRAGDGREHRLEVKVKRQDVRVRHRRSYRDKSTLERAADRTLSALFYGAEENPLEVALEIGDITAAEGKTFRVPVRLNIPLHKLFLQDNTQALVGKVRLLVATQNSRGDTSRVRQVEVPIQIPREKALIALGKNFQYELTLTMPAGDQRVAVAIQDAATSQVSYLSRDVNVTSSSAGAGRQR